MPPPKKLDLIPEQLRQRLAEVLRDRGFGQIVETTEDLNAWLEDEGLEITVGKTAVGDFSKALKDQREAFAVADALMQSMDVEDEGKVQAGLYQMISATAMHAIMHVRDDDKHLSADESAKYARMMKDLMSSSGMREKLLADERARVAREAREAMEAEQSQRLSEAVASGSIDASAAQRAREVMGFA